MVRIGWLADRARWEGGAEMSGKELIAGCPDNFEVELCRANRRPRGDFDLFILQNVVTYTARWIDVLEGVPLIQHFRDPWHPGDVRFRRYVLDNARMVIFNSDMARRDCPWAWNDDAAVALVPPPVDLPTFRRAARSPAERFGNVYLGRVDMVKGIHRAIDWCYQHNEPLDVYGPMNMDIRQLGEIPESIIFHGAIPYPQVPAVLGKAQRFIMLPGNVESYSRTTVEAWAAGAELVVDDTLIGAMQWIRECPEMLEPPVPVNRFWGSVKSIL